MLRNMERIPNNDLLGTRIGNKYEWNTWRESFQLAEDFSHGAIAMNLSPEVTAEN